MPSPELGVAMQRRAFITLFGGAAATWPLGARAQQTAKIFRIGFLWDSPLVFPEAMEAFRKEIRELGYVEGRNIIIEHRWAEGKPEKMRQLAQELVQLKVDLIVAPSSIYTAAARDATSSIPIIFFSHADPLGSGHVVSLGQPGGNATGISLMMTETNVKLLELSKEAVPGLSRIAVLWDPTTPSHRPGLLAVEGAAKALGLQVQSLAVPAAVEYESAFDAMTRQRADAVLVLSTPIYTAGAQRLAELAIAHKLPSMFGPSEHTRAGGLMSYGPDRADLWRRGAIYVDQVLKGVKPADLPVQQPTKFELAINLRTARMLGIKIPEAFVLRADTVIE
jgi:putative ABC transport system substrate-binding protein